MRTRLQGRLVSERIDAGSNSERVAVLLDDALAAKAGLYLTGEIPHHDALRATAAGTLVICTLHSNSERAALPRLRDRLANGTAGRPPPVAGIGLGPPDGRDEDRVLGPAPPEHRTFAAGPAAEADHEDLDPAGPQVNPDNRPPTTHSAHPSGPPRSPHRVI